ncbi:MAG: permease [Erysipelotrichaceae bacterium]
MQIFAWLNDAILKMTWLSDLMSFIVEKVFGLDLTSQLGASLQFFMYDTVKIFILLSVLIFTVSYIQSYFPPERTRKILGKYKGISANLFGALLGTITPFCSCSSIPLFIGFTSAGLPIGVTFSFLISSPLVDIASVILLASIFNWKIAIAYVIVGVILAVVSGTIISKLHMEDQVESFVFNKYDLPEIESETLKRKERVQIGIEAVKEIVRKVWLYVLIGVGIGALIHNVIPESMITAVLGVDKWYSVPLATLVGVPMYADIFGTLPIAEALVTKGVGIGTALSFMMAVTALSLPSIVMLKKVVKNKLLIVFVSIVTVGIMVIGFLFNAFGMYLM